MLQEKTKKKQKKIVIFLFLFISIFISNYGIDIYKLHGNYMAPMLNENDIIVTNKFGILNSGDLVVCQKDSQVFVARLIAKAGESVNIDEKGNVIINGTNLDEPYIKDKDFGDCDIALPCKIEENQYFVMQDNRKDSIDSRNSLVGLISREQIIGKVKIKVYPLTQFSLF